MKNLLFFFSFSLLFLSCSKEDLLSSSPSLIGKWTHFSANDAWETLFIESDGTGKVEWFTNNKLKEETKVKKWFTEDNRLYFGKVTFSLQPYTISEYPVAISQNEVIDFDTLTVGGRVMQLNQLNFIEKE